MHMKELAFIASQDSCRRQNMSEILRLLQQYFLEDGQNKNDWWLAVGEMSALKFTLKKQLFLVVNVSWCSNWVFFSELKRQIQRNSSVVALMHMLGVKEEQAQWAVIHPSLFRKLHTP